jgi:CubicO group peptidase (beta-lactamase class C family)
MRVRPSLLIVSVLVLMVAGLVLSRGLAPVTVRGQIEAEMAQHGLSAANIALGRAGQAPQRIAINTAHGVQRPYYSISKPLTAAAALRVLAPDDEVSGASVRQLLQHTAGWDRAIAGDPVTAGTTGAACTDLPAPPRQFQPGGRYAYSNIGYCLVGKALETRTGEPYRATVNRLFPETRAMGFDPVLGPAGGWSGTAEQFYLFAARPLPAGTLQIAVPRPGDLPYGLGWAIGPDHVTHFGAHGSNFTLVVKRGDFVAVALFAGRPPDDALAAKALRARLLALDNAAAR